MHKFRCGTQYPVYLEAQSDPLPKKLYEKKSVKACAHSGPYCSTYGKPTIDITNCGDYNVYNLDFLPVGVPCPTAYCTSTKVACRAGTFSKNGFQPGCTDQVPIYNGKPFVEYQVDHSKNELNFFCNVSNVRFANNLEHFRQIEWYMTRASDITGRPTLVHLIKGLKAQVTHLLTENDWRDDFSLGVNITCEIKGFTSQDTPGDTATSNVFFAGLRATPDLLEIRGDNKGMVTITPTIPVLCPKQFITNNVCTQKLRVSVITRDRASATCANGEFNGNIIVRTGCGTDITPLVTNEVKDQSAILSIQGRQPDVYNGDATSSLALNVQTQKTFAIWKQKLPDINIKVLNENAATAKYICRSYTDPNLRTFAGRYYAIQKDGTFIMYKHRTLPLQVQVRYERCVRSNPYAFCNCGLAVQSGRDVFVYDNCNKKIFNRLVRFLRLGVLGCDNKAMVINKQFDNGYEITLPTGTKISTSPMVGRFIRDIRITATAADFGFNTIGGVCGVIVDVKGEEMKPKGATAATQNVTEFWTSWKVNNEENLFLNPGIVSNASYALPTQCECQNSNNVTEAFCDATVAGTKCNIKDDETLLRVCNAGKRRKREILEQADNDIFADKFTFPEEVGGVGLDRPCPTCFPIGWTENRARAECNNYLTKAPTGCLELPTLQYNSVIEACISDIKASGTTEFALGALQVLLKDCVIEIVSNNTVIVEVDPSDPNPPSRTTTMRPISAQAENLLKEICPGACNLRGGCVEGQCQCYDGYGGVDCSIDLNKAPSGLLLLNNGLCDLQKRSCMSTIVFGEDISTVQEVSCVVKEFIFEDNNGHQNKRTKTAEYTVQATVMSAGQVRCTLRRTVPGRLVYVYNISLTNGGNISEAEQMIVFESNCYSTTEEKQPVLKDDVCVINSTCHAKNILNPEDNQEFCKPEESQLTWTVQPAPSNLRIPNNGVCDVKNGSCFSPVISAQNISSLTGVSCVVEEYVFEDNNGHQNTKVKVAEYTVPATSVLADQVRCTLRRTVPGRLVYAYEIALTNGGDKSELETFILLETNCYSITEDNQPNLKDNVCVINSTCFLDGALNPDNNQELCKPSDNQFSWSPAITRLRQCFNLPAAQRYDCVLRFVRNGD